MKLADNKATLSFSNGNPSMELPIYQGNIGPDVIDIRKLYGQTGMFTTYDPGFLSTASCQSAITYIDGDKGECCTVATPSNSWPPSATTWTPATCCSGRAADTQQRADFHKLVLDHTMVNEQMQFFLRGFRRDAHPMAVLTGLVGAMSAFYHMTAPTSITQSTVMWLRSV